MMKRYRLSISIVSVWIVVLLGIVQPGQCEKVQLEYFMLANSGEKLVWDQAVQLFEEANPTIAIKTTWCPTGQYVDKLRVRLAAGTPPDLTRIIIEEYQGFAAKGTFLDLTPYIAAEEAKNPEFKAQMADYMPMLLDALRYKGGLHGLPSDWNDAIIFYNQDLFDAAGIPYPSADWTVVDFVNIAQRLTKDTDGDGKIDQYGYMMTGDWFDSFCPWIWTFGGEILNADWTASKMNEQGAIDGIAFMNDLVNTYKVSPTPAVRKQYDNVYFFMNGKAAMAHYGRYLVPDFHKSLTFKWDVQQQPIGPKGQRGVPYGLACLSVSAKTPHPKEAFDFVRFMSSPKIVQLFNQLGNSIPVLQSVVDQDDFKHPTYAPKNQYAMIEALKFARLIPSPPKNAQIMKVAVTEIESLLMNTSLSPKDVAERIHQKITAILNQ